MKLAICGLVLVLVSMPGVCAAQSATGVHVEDLRSKAPLVRRQAAVRLGRTADRSAVPALIGALEDPVKDVRREAAKALGAIKDGSAVGPLVDAMGDADKNVRFYAAYALGEIKDPKAADALLGGLRDPEWCVRDQAAWALREIGAPTLVGPLAAALTDPNADVSHVFWLLRHAGGRRAVEHVAALLENPDARTRTRAVVALYELHTAEAVAPLIAALADVDPGVRRLAIGALLEIGDDRARKPLRDLAAREKDPSVRQAAEAAVFEMSAEKHLVAYWSFDDRSTDVARDATSRGNDGEIRGATAVEGKVGAALRFGRGKYIELGQPAGLPIANKPLTIMAWIKSEADRGVVVARGGAFCGFSLYLKDGVAKFGIQRAQEGPGYIVAGRENVVGAWVHLAGVVKIDRIELYVNGKLAATEKTTGYIPGNCGQGMEIGYDVSNSPAEIIDAFQGVIDEVKVYHAALGEEEIAEQCCSKEE